MLYSLILASTILANVVSVPAVEVPIDNIRIALEKLSFCESSHRPKISRIDTNGLKSFGRFQYQQWIWDWYKDYYGLYDYEITNDEHQWDLTQRILEDKQGEKLWRVCFKKYQLNNYL